MAEPGDPKASGAPKPDRGPDQGPDHDADVGFVSPASLTGRAVERPVSAPEPEPEEEPDLFDPPAPALAAEPTPATPPAAAPGPFDRTVAEPARVEPRPAFGRAATPPPAPMRLYAVYVLILLAVPTLGVAAVIALLAVIGREPPEAPVAASHFVYQQRTLWIAAIAAVLGAVLVVVNVGVFVLFVLAVWIIARGAYGVLKLNAGRPVPNPRGWLF